MRRFGTLALLAGALYLAPPQLSFSADRAPCDPWVAKMVSVQGVVEVRRAGQTQWVPARLNDLYCGGDRIQLGDRSRADIVLINQPVLRLDQNTTITLGGIKDNQFSLLDLLKGAIYFFSRFPRNLEIRTAFVNAGVEGTEGLIAAEADRALITIFEGRVLATNAFGNLSIASGQSAVAEKGKAPVPAVVVRPRDAVRWTLYYVPTLYFREADFPPGPGWQGMVRKSLEAWKRGDYPAAFDAIERVPPDLNDPRFLAYRGALLLAVGRYDQANRDLDQALSVAPDYSDAWALRSITAVVRNEKERAWDAAKRAAAADPKSASALIALSYAQQANFDLQGAVKSLQQAVQLDSGNALAWARLAELWLSFSRLNEALEAAQKAATIDPSLSRTQMILGYAHLLRVATAEAKNTFERAIELDQADPLSRLGLGLARIREGDLEEGRREIEIAVSLDPDNALIRSYLGKAYYEEKRDAPSAAQYEMAKDLDPKDPTPYFYDAIRKQTTNRPVEALQDMQRAIELNDNRAVYRSRLQLDSDLAARSAALGRIYSDLGFQQLALVEGWKSVNTDPTDFSAHRLLADSYSILPRHEIARVSELLQSQLLQPLNMTPIQPRLAESNLFLIAAGGPAGLSFNEFNPLFNRNGLNFQTTGLAGENKTYAGEGVLSGIYKNASFSLGGFHFQTDGWRRNSFQKDFIGNAFLQYELSPRTSVQAEVRRREIMVGDIQQRFFRQNFFPGQTETTDRLSIRLGGRHLISPDALLLASLIYHDTSFNLTDKLPIATSELKLPRTSLGIELQNILRAPSFNITSGIGYSDIDGRFKSTITPQFFPNISVDDSLRPFNIYSYTNIALIKSLTLTFGGSFDYIKGARTAVPRGQVDQINPKVGITWTPVVGTTFRASAFRVLKRALITDQTLEPTQVAGFNQFYDDVDLTKAWRYGVAVDQILAKNMFGGLEFSRRDVKIPAIDPTVSPPAVHVANTREYLARLYFLWTPQTWIALRTEYSFERFHHYPPLGQDGTLDTHRVPLGINLFHPFGVSSFWSITYNRQDGKVNNFSTGTLQPAKSNFWTVDAALNYRLPNRFGFLTLAAANLLDKRFRFFDTDANNTRLQPKRTLVFKLTLALP